MFRSAPMRVVIHWLAGLLGPPPPPPRRYFSKGWDRSSHRLAADGRGGHRRRAGEPGDYQEHRKSAQRGQEKEARRGCPSHL